MSATILEPAAAPPVARRLQCWSSTDELRAQSAAWDELWRRSVGNAPTTRAEPLALWLDHFAPDVPLEIWVAQETEGRLLAALPLVVRRARGGSYRDLPQNAWSDAGQLLVDPAADLEAILPKMLERAVEWPALWLRLREVDLGAEPWQAWQAVARRAGCLRDVSGSTEVGLVDIDGDWPGYEASRSRNLRHQMRQIVRRLGRHGGMELRVLDRLEADDIEAHLRRGFEVEDRSWKGAEGTSVLRTAGMFDFFLRQAQALAAAGHLCLVFVEVDGRPIAFEYGFTAHGVYYSPKVGYDPAYAEYCPGQLLRWLLLERFHRRRTVECVNFYGPLEPATRRWITRHYAVSDLRIVPPGLRTLAARPLVSGYRLWRRLARRG